MGQLGILYIPYYTYCESKIKESKGKRNSFAATFATISTMFWTTFGTFMLWSFDILTRFAILEAWSPNQK